MANVLHIDRSRYASATGAATEVTDWRRQLPVLKGRIVTLRELRESDAAALFAVLQNDEMHRFVAEPPSTPEDFRAFISWTRRQQEAGVSATFAVTIAGYETAIGLIQIREMARGFEIAEWGFAFAPQLWGTGAFQDAARLVLQFTFETLGVHRLEARVFVRNGRGVVALRRIGAIEEGVLRQSSRLNGRYVDQMLFSIVKNDWLAAGAGAKHQHLVIH